MNTASTAALTAPADYYCPQHKYTPMPGSGMAFCPQCECDGPRIKAALIWRHLCARGGFQPGDGTGCPDCAEAQRLPQPVTVPVTRGITIPLPLARQCHTGLECHLRGIEDKLRMRGLPYATRQTLERARRDYTQAIADLKTAIATPSIA